MSVYPIIMSQGKFIHKDSLYFPFEERGSQFGDGVYEVIRIYGGAPYLMDEHAARLMRSLAAIRIKLDYSETEVKNLLHTLIEKNDTTEDSFIYLQVTRGSAPRVHTFPENTEPNIYAYIADKARPLNLLTNGAHAITLPDERWDNCYIKSLNLLPNVLAKQKAFDHDCYEAILHRDETVTECSSSNIYMVKDNTIYTHPATNRILHGCVRSAVLRFAKEQGIHVTEIAFSTGDIQEADEMFLSSSTSEIIPVVKVDNQPVADGKPGPVTSKLQQAYEKEIGISSE
ncbi:MAG TPA: D-amino-acid transaminase [Pseudogracilibacillus sp.]|nr:D-amino-acid transaminase [Pseudogracilibacillus sp.]